MRTVFGDESYATNAGVGFYAVGLLSISNADIEYARDFARTMRPAGKARIHFHDVQADQRAALALEVARGPWKATAWVARANPRQQERVRHILLKHASFGRESETWILESRSKSQDRNDVRLFASVFVDGRRNPVQVVHSPSSAEPLLWMADGGWRMADVVASATSTGMARGLDIPFATELLHL
jgi:hypothetical protein